MSHLFKVLVLITTCIKYFKCLNVKQGKKSTYLELDLKICNNPTNYLSI